MDEAINKLNEALKEDGVEQLSEAVGALMKAVHEGDEYGVRADVLPQVGAIVAPLVEVVRRVEGLGGGDEVGARALRLLGEALSQESVFDGLSAQAVQDVSRALYDAVSAGRYKMGVMGAWAANVSNLLSRGDFAARMGSAALAAISRDSGRASETLALDCELVLLLRSVAAAEYAVLGPAASSWVPWVAQRAVLAGTRRVYSVVQAAVEVLGVHEERTGGRETYGPALRRMLEVTVAQGEVVGLLASALPDSRQLAEDDDEAVEHAVAVLQLWGHLVTQLRGELFPQHFLNKLLPVASKTIASSSARARAAAFAAWRRLVDVCALDPPAYLGSRSRRQLVMKPLLRIRTETCAAVKTIQRSLWARVVLALGPAVEEAFADVVLAPLLVDGDTPAAEDLDVLLGTVAAASDAASRPLFRAVATRADAFVDQLLAPREAEAAAILSCVLERGRAVRSGVDCVHALALAWVKRLLDTPDWASIRAPFALLHTAIPPATLVAPVSTPLQALFGPNVAPTSVAAHLFVALFRVASLMPGQEGPLSEVAAAIRSVASARDGALAALSEAVHLVQQSVDPIFLATDIFPAIASEVEAILPPGAGDSPMVPAIVRVLSDPLAVSYPIEHSGPQLRAKLTQPMAIWAKLAHSAHVALSPVSRSGALEQGVAHALLDVIRAPATTVRPSVFAIATAAVALANNGGGDGIAPAQRSLVELAVELMSLTADACCAGGASVGAVAAGLLLRSSGSAHEIEMLAALCSATLRWVGAVPQCRSDRECEGDCRHRREAGEDLWLAVWKAVRARASRGPLKDGEGGTVARYLGAALTSRRKRVKEAALATWNDEIAPRIAAPPAALAAELSALRRRGVPVAGATLGDDPVATPDTLDSATLSLEGSRLRAPVIVHPGDVRRAPPSPVANPIELHLPPPSPIAPAPKRLHPTSVSDGDYVVIPPRKKRQPLTEHQKERRHERPNLPPIYTSLDQSQGASMDASLPPEDPTALLDTVVGSDQSLESMLEAQRKLSLAMVELERRLKEKRPK